MNLDPTHPENFYARALAEFHGHPHSILDDEQAGLDLRSVLLDEEVAELIEALEESDRAHIAREAADVLYVCFGSVNVCGLPADVAAGRMVSAPVSVAQLRACQARVNEALAQRDRAAIAAQLGTMVGLLFALAEQWQLDLGAAFVEVHRACMDKMVVGLRRDDSKLLKPPGWRAPDMSAALL